MAEVAACREIEPLALCRVAPRSVLRQRYAADCADKGGDRCSGGEQLGSFTHQEASSNDRGTCWALARKRERESSPRISHDVDERRLAAFDHGDRPLERRAEILRVG